MLHILAGTGMRASEAAGLDLADLTPAGTAPAREDGPRRRGVRRTGREDTWRQPGQCCWVADPTPGHS